MGEVRYWRDTPGVEEYADATEEVAALREKADLWDAAVEFEYGASERGETPIAAMHQQLAALRAELAEVKAELRDTRRDAASVIESSAAQREQAEAERDELRAKLEQLREEHAECYQIEALDTQQSTMVERERIIGIINRVIPSGAVWHGVIIAAIREGTNE